MIIPFIVAILCIGAMMLIFLARTLWGNRDDLFYLSGKQRIEVIKDQFPQFADEKQKKDPEADETIQYMLSLLGKSDEENYTR